MACTRMLKKSSKGHNLETKNGEQSFLCMTRHPDLTHIPIKLNEDIPNSTELWSVQECLEKIIKGA